MTINLDNLDGLEKKYIAELKKFDKVFKCHTSNEKVRNIDKINSLVQRLNDHCLENTIYGFHYTNAIKKDITNHGLIIRTGKQIRTDFEKKYFHLFTEKEQTLIKTNWDVEFKNNDIESRDSRVFFNFTTNALFDKGADLLLQYFGGEQIYFPIYELPTIGNKLKKIGEPMILKCVLQPKLITTFTELSWGKIILSSYHKKINPNVVVIDFDGFQKEAITAENIEILNPDFYI